MSPTATPRRALRRAAARAALPIALPSAERPQRAADRAARRRLPLSGRGLQGRAAALLSFFCNGPRASEAAAAAAADEALGWFRRRGGRPTRRRPSRAPARARASYAGHLADEATSTTEGTAPSAHGARRARRRRRRRRRRRGDGAAARARSSPTARRCARISRSTRRARARARPSSDYWTRDAARIWYGDAENVAARRAGAPPRARGVLGTRARSSRAGRRRAADLGALELRPRRAAPASALRTHARGRHVGVPRGAAPANLDAALERLVDKHTSNVVVGYYGARPDAEGELRVTAHSDTGRARCIAYGEGDPAGPRGARRRRGRLVARRPARPPPARSSSTSATRCAASPAAGTARRRTACASCPRASDRLALIALRRALRRASPASPPASPAAPEPTTPRSATASRRPASSARNYHLTANASERASFDARVADGPHGPWPIGARAPRRHSSSPARGHRARPIREERRRRDRGRVGREPEARYAAGARAGASTSRSNFCSSCRGARRRLVASLDDALDLADAPEVLVVVGLDVGRRRRGRSGVVAAKPRPRRASRRAPARAAAYASVSGRKSVAEQSAQRARAARALSRDETNARAPPIGAASASARVAALREQL